MALEEECCNDNSLTASSVESVEVQASQIEFDNLSQHHPSTGLAGKFGMEFCLAILLLDGKAGLREFSDETVNRPDVQEMLGRVKLTVDPKLEESDAWILSVRLKDGRSVSGSTSFAKGSPQNPMSFDEVAESSEIPRDSRSGRRRKLNPSSRSPNLWKARRA